MRGDAALHGLCARFHSCVFVSLSLQVGVSVLTSLDDETRLAPSWRGCGRHLFQVLVATHSRVSCCLTGSCLLILVDLIDGVHFLCFYSTPHDVLFSLAVSSHLFRLVALRHCYLFPLTRKLTHHDRLVGGACVALGTCFGAFACFRCEFLILPIVLVLSLLYDSFPFVLFAIVSCNSLRPLGFLFHHFDQSGQVLQRVLPRLSNPLPLALMQHRWCHFQA